MNCQHTINSKPAITLLVLSVCAASCGSEHPAETVDGHQIDWTYSGAQGPEHWGELGESFSSCCYGVKQSPIDIEVDREGSHEVEMRYTSAHEVLVNNGHTIQLQYESGSQVVFDGKPYNLLQLHFHTPSEHQIDGASFALESHLVHLNADGEYLVVSLLFEEGEANSFIETLVAKAPEKQGSNDSGTTLNVGDLFPDTLGFYFYQGSFTTPPCTESVTWLVLDQPAQVSASQVRTLERLEGTNNRPQQTKGQRVVEHFR